MSKRHVTYSVKTCNVITG